MTCLLTVLLSRICSSSDWVCHRGCRLTFSSIPAGVYHQWHRSGIAGLFFFRVGWFLLSLNSLLGRSGERFRS
jgi:hypothetical protein